MTFTTAFLLFDGAEELDVVGPYEVFGVAAMKKPDTRVLTVEPRGVTVRCAKGMRIVPDHSFADVPAIDVLFVPGGKGTREHPERQQMAEWIAHVATKARFVASVCTGAFLVDLAGLTRGKRVTTHWQFTSMLRERGNAQVLDHTRYVRDGNLLTAAGVSAGIDLALWLAGELWGREFAREVTQYMEYDPAPPYRAEV
ncbi:MAG: DJ-1/PfpI family protein [Gemmatimonadaceae bacterium]|nr:DJ-1/PfpI family protein [Planctomycetota bacterium]NUQ10934.1 DJ-1/PfpI family protein [Gemmatimonadaceae bacterium]